MVTHRQKETETRKRLFRRFRDSSEELKKDNKSQRARSRTRSVPRRVRGKQKDPRRKRQEEASSSRDRPNLPIAKDDKNDDQDSNESEDSDKTVFATVSIEPKVGSYYLAFNSAKDITVSNDSIRVNKHY